MGKYYDQASIPAELRRNFNVYDRIEKLRIDLGTFDDNVGSLSDANIADAVIHESGLVYLSGTAGGTLPMNDDLDRIKHGQEGAQYAADVLIKTLHWVISCGGEGDLNDVLYTVKVLGMVVSPGGGVSSVGPQVTDGFSLRWQSVFGGGRGQFAQNGIDPGGFSGVHARSAMGGFDGRFSAEPEIIVAIPIALAHHIIMNRGWVFPLPPLMLTKVRSLR